MSESELQEEEREVLSSIYDGDQCFKEINTTTFQYKFGESETVKSFLLEIKWTAQYPNEIPEISMDTFYNNHLVRAVKDKIIKSVATEAEQYQGMPMTYSLFEYVKGIFDDLSLEQPESIDNTEDMSTLTITTSDQSDLSKKVPKKEQLTKAQKRRQWNKVDSKGEKPRGWDWIDIIKHLSQRGSREPDTPMST